MVTVTQSMMRLGKKKYVQELCDGVKAEILEIISAGKIPSEWDYHELRVLLADKFTQYAAISVIKREPRSKRARAFKNYCLTKL